MRISVITVCHNSAPTLEKCLKSVADQDYKSVEHIVIDGGSSDGSREILDKFKGHIAAQVCEADNGIYDAMNKGLALASGDIICFLNSDDRYHRKTVLSEVCVEFLSHNLEVLFGDVAVYKDREFTRQIRRYNSGRFDPSRLSWGWMPAHPALFLHKSIVQRVGQFKTNYRIAADFEYIVRIFNSHTVRFKYMPTVFVDMLGGGVSSSGVWNRILLNVEVLRACRDNGLRTNILKILSKYGYKYREFLIE